MYAYYLLSLKQSMYRRPYSVRTDHSLDKLTRYIGTFQQLNNWFKKHSSMNAILIPVLLITKIRYCYSSHSSDYCKFYSKDYWFFFSASMKWIFLSGYLEVLFLLSQWPNYRNKLSSLGRLSKFSRHSLPGS